MMLRRFLNDLRGCRGGSCSQGDYPCTEHCLEDPGCNRRASTAANDPNLGTLDPTLCNLLRDAVHMGVVTSEPEHFQAGYVSGHRHGWVNGAFVGAVVGASIVAAAIQLGLWAGGAL